MALDPKRKAACRAAILDHLEHVGSREWNTVRDAFPDVPHATFWRLIRTARAEMRHAHRHIGHSGALFLQTLEPPHTALELVGAAIFQ